MDFLFVDDPSDDEVDIKFTTKDDEAACASFWELRSQRVSQASMLFRGRGESPVSFEEEEQVITGNLFERSQREMFRDFPGSAPSSPPYSYYSPSSSNHSTPALHLSNHISLNLSLADPSQDPYFQDADAIICTRNSPPVEHEPCPIPEQTSPITHSPNSFDVPSLGSPLSDMRLQHRFVPELTSTTSPPAKPPTKLSTSMPTTQSPSQDQYTISPVPLTISQGPETPNHDTTSTASRTVQKTSQLIPKKSSKPGTKPKRHLCPIAGCGETFTRRNDVLRHQRNAAKHRGIFPQNQDEESRTRCKFCGEELSRADARKRHELKASCGKRTIRKKVLGDPSTTKAHL